MLAHAFGKAVVESPRVQNGMRYGFSGAFSLLGARLAPPNGRFSRSPMFLREIGSKLPLQAFDGGLKVIVLSAAFECGLKPF